MYSITDEASCRAYLQVLLIGAAMVPRVEVHNALGRSDMEVEAEKRLWVFEMKFARNVNEVDALLADAIKQIQTHRYGSNQQNKELIRIALVFSAKQREFTAWKRV